MEIHGTGGCWGGCGWFQRCFWGVFWGVFSLGGMDLGGIQFASFLVGHEMPPQAKSKEDGFDMVLTGVSLGGGMAAMIGSKEGAAPHRVPRKLWDKSSEVATDPL